MPSAHSDPSVHRAQEEAPVALPVAAAAAVVAANAINVVEAGVMSVSDLASDPVLAPVRKLDFALMTPGLLLILPPTVESEMRMTSVMKGEPGLSHVANSSSTLENH